MGAAIQYLSEYGIDNVERHDHYLTTLAAEMLGAEPDVDIYGPTTQRSAVLSFNVKGIHPHDLAGLLDREGVAIRAGHHCAQPLMRWLGVPATARASFYIYNLEEDVTALIEAVRVARKVMA